MEAKEKMTYREFFKALHAATKKFPVKKHRVWDDRLCLYHSRANGGLWSVFEVVVHSLDPLKPLPASNEAAMELLPKIKAKKLMMAAVQMPGYSKPLRKKLLEACRLMKR